MLGVDAVRADDGPGKESVLHSDALFVYSAPTTAAPSGLAYPYGLVCVPPHPQDSRSHGSGLKNCLAWHFLNRAR